MKLQTGLSLLLFVALTYAAPRSPAIVQVYEPEQLEEDPLPVADHGPRDENFGLEEEEVEADVYDSLTPDEVIDSNPILGDIDLNFNVNEGNIPLLVNDTITSIIFRDLENRIAEDVKRMQADFLLFQRLFGQRSGSGYRPSWFLPWAVPDYTPEDRPSPIPDYPDNYQPDYNLAAADNDKEDGNPFSGFPFLGLDRPLFPGLPDLPGFGIANPENLPDNYSNKTHEVHSINGTQVVVNNTINKESGDNFNSFFHHQVIHFKPEEEDEANVPKEDPEVITQAPEPEIPQESDEDGEDEIKTILPEVDNEANSGNTNAETIPEVNQENSLDSIPVDPVADNEEFENNLVWQPAEKGVAVRSLDEFHPIIFPDDDLNILSIPFSADDPNIPSIPFSGPKSAAYISNSLDTEDEFEEVDIPDEERRAPDLSKDTRVNRIHADKQGIVKIDPDAEIFNYGLVMREARPREDDK